MILRQQFQGLNKIILTTCLLFASMTLFSQINFTAKLSSSRVGVNQQFTVTYSLTGGRSESFERPPFAGFRLIGQSSITGGGSMQMYVNGQLISGNEGEQSWTFTLMPTTTGTFDISPAKVKVNGTWIESQPLKVTVVNTPQNPTPMQSQTQSQAHQQQGSKQGQQQQTEKGAQNGLKSDDVMISANADKTSAWVGEPIIITYRIHTKVSIPSYAINKIPAFDGFWSENLIDPNTKPQQSEEIINGQRYTTALLRKIIVYPQRSGKLTLEPLEAEIIARIVRQRQQPNTRDWMDQMFNNFFSNPFGSDPFSSFSGFGSAFEDIKTTVKSNTITLNIRDLPSKNRTADFTGQVGKFSMESWIDKDRILIDDALNLYVKISGNGNMSLLQAPEVQFPKSFDVFDPQTEDNTKVSSSGLSGSKTFNYLIVPREPGNFTIPSVKFTFFDPSTGDYKTISTEDYKIQVVGQGSQVVSSDETEQDIRFIHLKNSKFRTKNSFFFGTLWHYVLFILPLILFITFIIILRRHIQLHSNEKLLKYKQATKTAKKRLKKASHLLNSGKFDEFYEETSRAIWSYLAHRFSIQQADLSVEKVIQQLQSSGVNDDNLTHLKETLDFCEFIRFAPGASTTTPGDILQKAENTIRNLEQHIQQFKHNHKIK